MDVSTAGLFINKLILELIKANGKNFKVTFSISGTAIEQFKRGKGDFVFKGDYVGIDPDDPKDTCDLRGGYLENENTSYPLFHYILSDIITIDN